MRLCDACGTDVKGGFGIGGALLCRSCAVDVRAELDAGHAAGKSVNAMGIAKRMFRADNDTSDCKIRDMPQGLWDQAKHRAITDGISLRDLVIIALSKYLG